MTKMLLASLAIFIFSTPALAENLCSPSDSYKSRVELSDGSTLFVEPGIYAENGLEYHFECNLTCDAQELIRLCKHLGLSDFISVHEVRGIDMVRQVRFINDGLEFGVGDEYISEIVCR
jgi:hypothetical protein